MTYIKQNWLNNDPMTPVSAGRLNHIENGVEAVDVALGAVDSALVDIDSALAALSGGVTSATITTIVSISAADYAALTTPDPATLYLVTA